MKNFQFEDDNQYEYIVPHYTHDKQPISQERIDDYVNALKYGSIERNNGFSILRNIGNKFLADSGEIPSEDIVIVKTHGRTPLPDTALRYFVDYLSQESLFVGEGSEWKAYFYKGLPMRMDEKNIDKIEYGDGSYSTYDLTHNHDGLICLNVKHYDRYGALATSFTQHKDDIDRIESLGNIALSKIYDAYTEVIGRVKVSE